MTSILQTFFLILSLAMSQLAMCQTPAGETKGSALAHTPASRLLVVSEQYPDLKATAGFRDLQAELEGTENRISVERERFNEAVQTYDTAVKSFPAVFYAGAMGFKEKPYFTATTGADKPPQVQFDFNTPAKH